MTNAAFNAKPATAAETKQIILQEIGAKWGKIFRAGGLRSRWILCVARNPGVTLAGNAASGDI
jgi:hypothetical protein